MTYPRFPVVGVLMPCRCRCRETVVPRRLSPTRRLLFYCWPLRDSQSCGAGSCWLFRSMVPTIHLARGALARFRRSALGTYMPLAVSACVLTSRLVFGLLSCPTAPNGGYIASASFRGPGLFVRAWCFPELAGSPGGNHPHTMLRPRRVGWCSRAAEYRDLKPENFLFKDRADDSELKVIILERSLLVWSKLQTHVCCVCFWCG